jgi:hypothetical protein
MGSFKAKTIFYLMVVLVLSSLIGMVVMKFSGAEGDAAGKDTRTQAEKLDALEKSPGLTSPQAKSFIQNERNRMDATREVDKAVGQ